MSIDKKKIHLAIAAVTAAAFCYAIASALVKVAEERELSSAMLLFWRSIISMIFLLPILLMTPPRYNLVEKLKTNHLNLLLVRGITSFVGVLMYFYVLKFLSVADATLLYFTIPLFMPFIGYLWKRHIFPKEQWLGLFIGFVGITCVVKPGHELFHPASLLGLAVGLIISIGQFAVHLATPTESSSRINFYLLTTLIVLSFPLTFFAQAKGYQQLNKLDFSYIFWMAVSSIIYLYLLNYALKSAPPAFITSFFYVIVIFSMALDYIFWGVVAHWLTWAGAILIAIGVLLMYLMHHRKADY